MFRNRNTGSASRGTAPPASALRFQFRDACQQFFLVGSDMFGSVPGRYSARRLILGETAGVHDLFTERCHALKSEHGYSGNDITVKPQSLEGVLVPVAARWNEQMLEAAGFRQIARFWRWMNFAGWLAVK